MACTCQCLTPKVPRCYAWRQLAVERLQSLEAVLGDSGTFSKAATSSSSFDVQTLHSLNFQRPDTPYTLCTLRTAPLGPDLISWAEVAELSWSQMEMLSVCSPCRCAIASLSYAQARRHQSQRSRWLGPSGLKGKNKKNTAGTLWERPSASIPTNLQNRAWNNKAWNNNWKKKQTILLSFYIYIYIHLYIYNIQIYIYTYTIHIYIYIQISYHINSIYIYSWATGSSPRPPQKKEQEQVHHKQPV